MEVVQTQSIKWNLIDTLKTDLGGTDNIHDFDDNGGRVPTYSWDSVSSNLLTNLQLLNRQGAATFTGWLSNTYSGSVSASNVEDQTIIYFEKNYPTELNKNKRKIISYRDIINNFENQDYKNDIQKAYILELDLSELEDWGRDYSESDKKKIGLFILDYFFPPPNDDPTLNSSNKTYMSFDAGSNMPDKIFGNMDQVINLVTPLNIADSALTESHLNGKNYYFFPTSQTNEPYVYESNIYTQNNYNLNLLLTTPEYNRNNRYDFKIDIKDKANNPLTTLLFNSDNKSGPSVTYLSESINQLQNNGNISASSDKMVSLTELNRLKQDKNLIKLLFDLKRSGDWEQANASNISNQMKDGRVIFSTIDRLCALYSRCINQNTLYHYNTKLILYRFDGIGLSDEQKMLNKIEYMKEKMIAFTNQNVIIQQFLDIIINSKKSILQDFNQRVIFKYKLNTDVQKICSFFSRKLIEITNIQLDSIINGLQTKKSGVNNNEYNNLLNQYNSKPELMNLSNQQQITTLSDQQKKDIDNLFNSIKNFNFGFDVELTQLSLLFGSSVTIENVLTFTNLLKNVIKNGQYSEGQYGYYKYTLINKIKEIFAEIIRYNPDKISLTKSKRNDYLYYKDKLFLYESIENLLTYLNLLQQKDMNISNIIELLKNINTTNYSKTTDQIDFVESNNTYNKTLQDIINEIIENIPNPIVGGDPINNKKRKDERSGEEDIIEPFKKYKPINNENTIENTIENISIQLLNEFIKLSESISSITTILLKKNDKENTYKKRKLDEYNSMNDKQTTFDEFISKLLEMNLNETTVNEISVCIVEYINNVSSLFIEMINLYEIDTIKKVLDSKSKLKDYIYIHIQMCFLFGIPFYYKYSNEPKYFIENAVDRQDKNANQVLNSEIYGILFDYLEIQGNYEGIRKLFEIVISSFEKTSHPEYTKKMVLMIWMSKIIKNQNRTVGFNILLILFSYFNKIFIENIKICYPDDYTERGYYDGLFSYDTSLFNYGDLQILPIQRINDTLFLRNLTIYSKNIDYTNELLQHISKQSVVNGELTIFSQSTRKKRKLGGKTRKIKSILNHKTSKNKKMKSILNHKYKTCKNKKHL